MLSLVVLLGSQGLTAANNLVRNSDFADNLSGWGQLYTRTPNSGSVTLTTGTKGHRAAKVISQDDRDWAFSQEAVQPVRGGDIVEIEGSVKTSTAIQLELSVVSRDAHGEVLNWDLGAIGTNSVHDWLPLHRRFVIPRDCASIQYRLVGTGKGEVGLEEPSLKISNNVSSIVSSHIQPVAISNSSLNTEIGPDGSIICKDLRNGHIWKENPGDPNLLVRQLEKTDGRSAKIYLYDVGDDRNHTVSVALKPSGPELEISIGNAPGEMNNNLQFPGPMRTVASDWLIEPLNEGILYRAGDPTAPEWSLVTYGGHGICMPWFGIENPTDGSGAMGIVETPDDAEVSWRRNAQGVLQPGPEWEPSRQTLRYERKISWSFFDHGGYVAQAKRYREYAKSIGLVKTLRDKEKGCPAIDRLVGAVNVWNWDMDVRGLAHQLKDQGFDRVLWSRGGSAEEMTDLNGMGFLSSRYDIYQDVWDPKIALPWMNTKGWPDDLVLLPNGDWMKGWSHPDRQPDGSVKWIQGGVICSEKGLERAKREIPAELKTIPYLCRFIDTTTASPFRECYNPLHPLSRSDDRHYKMGLLDFISDDLHLVTGSETGLDASVPHVDYFEGMMSLGPYRLPDAGTDMLGYRKPTADFLKYQVGSYHRLPLWELVYHDCTVSQWYWGDATNKAPEVWDERDLLNVLYGTAPLLAFDKAEWDKSASRMKQTYKKVCEWTRKIGYDELLNHEFLTTDHTVQRSKFSSGRSVIVNFGPQNWKSGAIEVPAKGFVTASSSPQR